MYVKEQRHSRVIQDLTTKLKEHVKVMGNHVVRFFQGWGNDIDSLICDSGSKIVDCVLTVCKLTGEMSLATDMNIISFEQLNCEEADKNEVCFVECESCFIGYLFETILQKCQKEIFEEKNLNHQIEKMFLIFFVTLFYISFFSFHVIC